MENYLEVKAGGTTVRIPRSEIRFRTARSSGPGGQNVNKLETRVELEFDVVHASCLSDTQKRALLDRLGSQISSAGVLRVVSQESRSQWSNKEAAVRKFAAMLEKALRPPKKRIPTKPTSLSRERRLRSKKRKSEMKKLRRLRDD